MQVILNILKVIKCILVFKNSIIIYLLLYLLTTLNLLLKLNYYNLNKNYQLKYKVIII